MKSNAPVHVHHVGPCAIVSRQEIVERAEAYLREHMDGPVSLSRLSHFVGLSERALRNAFYLVRGIGPKRCMLLERLRKVRSELRHSDCHRTVTSVATRYGFYELGRFASVYKQAFGETPSQTLRRKRRPLRAGQPSNERGQSHACTS